jgi:RNA polymerase sigma factor (sigma-70 family)
MPVDCDLLRQFADHGDQAAFAELVRRHTNFVYSVALRVTCNGALAEDVTQTVFTIVARRAGKLRHYDTLLGWLHTTTRHVAINTIRGEVRRRTREHEATAMQNNSTAPEMNWSDIGPLLDEAVGQLKELDREAVLLRFFKNLSHQEVGAALGLGEEAARKRVDRAVEKLREFFARRGITATTTLLATAITQNSVQAAPVDLAAGVIKQALAGAGSSLSGGVFFSALTAFFMNSKIKLGIAAILVLLLALGLALKLPSSPEPQSSPAHGAAPVPKALALPAPPSFAQVVAPKVQPAPAIASVATDTATMAAVPDSPRLHLDTAMLNFVTMLETGDYQVALETYFQIPPTLSARDFVEKLRQNPDFPNTVKMLIESTHAAQTIPPVYNDTGDLATYNISPPVDGKTLVRWKKINDQWFVDAFE